MLRVRAATDAADFAGLPGDPDDYADQIRALWDEGGSSPAMCFVLERDGTRVGRLGLRISPTTDPSLLGSLPPEEMFTFGLHLPWNEDHVEAGRALVEGAIERLPAGVPELVESRVNSEHHSHPEAQVALFEHLGFTTFQEKQGYWWEHDGAPIEVPDRLEYRTLDEVGEDAYRETMAPCGEGTLDRNDRYYWKGCGPDNWARQMLALAKDPELWLLGYRAGEPVGYVAINAVEEWGATISHIGVLPAHRGNGYVADLLRAAMATVLVEGITTMLSDVDVLNHPMRNAFLSTGNRDDARPWHVWAFRRQIAAGSRQKESRHPG